MLIQADHSEPVHSYVLAVRCPKLAEAPDFCKEASREAVKALVDFIYSDKKPDFEHISVPGVFELWGMSLDLSLPRLEAFIRLRSVSLRFIFELFKYSSEFGQDPI